MAKKKDTRRGLREAAKLTNRYHIETLHTPLLSLLRILRRTKIVDYT
jgi:hypothetical protein